MRIKILLVLGVLLTLAVPTLASAVPPRDPQAPAAPTAEDAAVCVSFLATNAAGQTRVVTDNTPSFNTSTTYVNLPCGVTTVNVPRGRTGLIVVKVDAEVTCTETAPAVDTQWCLGRVLLNGGEGQPSAPEPDSFAWAQSSPDAAAWESAAFTRTRSLTCPATFHSPTCTYLVQAQVRNHSAGLSFRVDDLTVHATTTYQ